MSIMVYLHVLIRTLAAASDHKNQKKNPAL